MQLLWFGSFLTSTIRQDYEIVRAGDIYRLARHFYSLGYP